MVGRGNGLKQARRAALSPRSRAWKIVGSRCKPRLSLALTHATVARALSRPLLSGEAASDSLQPGRRHPCSLLFLGWACVRVHVDQQPLQDFEFWNDHIY